MKMKSLFALLLAVLMLTAVSSCKKAPLTVDLTRDKVYEFSDQTKDLMKNLDTEIYDEIFTVKSDDAFIAGRLMGKKEGILVAFLAVLFYYIPKYV